MRSSSRLILLALALALLSGALGCDSSPSVGSNRAATPQELANAVMHSGQDLRSAVSPFQLDMQIQIDQTKLSAEDAGVAGFLAGGIKVSGTASFAYDEQMLDLDLTLSASGVSYKTGLRMIKDEMWISMLGQWYDLTPALQQGLSSGDDPWQSADSQLLQDKMAELGVDVQTWLGDIKLVGRETLSETEVYHLSCAPDLTQMITDVTHLLQNRDFVNMFDPTGSLLGASGLAADLPTPQDLQDLDSDLSEMVAELSVDIWAGQKDDLPRQMDFQTRVIPPADADMPGIDSIALSVTASLTQINQPVSVKAPDNPLPYSQFKAMFGSDFPLPFITDPKSTEPVKS